MKLFDFELDKNKNHLPYDGTVHYYGCVLSPEQADRYCKTLLKTVDWQSDEILMFGKKITTKRKVAWYGDLPFTYTYSNTTKTALPWTEELLEIKAFVEKETGETFNSCLLNLYHNGEEKMSWHSDNEPDLKKNGAIASLSLGAERKFSFKHKHTHEKVDIILENGSLLVMKDTTQTHWLHQLPASKKIHSPRINLTFRTIVKI